MAEHQIQPGPPQVIIAGFGIPGRYVGELLDSHQIPYVVIDPNPATAQRCTTVRLLVGDARREETLRAAGIEHAHTIALTMPDENMVHEALILVRRLRPDIRIIARSVFTSAGLKAQQLGADRVVIAEQLVAKEFYHVLAGELFDYFHIAAKSD